MENNNGQFVWSICFITIYSCRLDESIIRLFDLKSIESDTYNALNSIMYAAEDALRYFDPNVNIYWDAFGYTKKY